jgi:fermentation-respiration switch protein FrsA (DUF1100 family)
VRHGADDEIIPFKQGKELFDSLKHIPSTPAGCNPPLVETHDLKHDDPLSAQEKAALHNYFNVLRV